MLFRSVAGAVDRGDLVADLFVVHAGAGLFVAGFEQKVEQVTGAGAGGAAHLPGMIAALTTLPVIGVPVELARLDGLDSLLSIVQMPKGVPVATVAINNATNAGLLALRILAVGSAGLAAQLEEYRRELNEQAVAQDRELPRP